METSSTPCTGSIAENIRRVEVGRDVRAGHRPWATGKGGGRETGRHHHSPQTTGHTARPACRRVRALRQTGSAGVFEPKEISAFKSWCREVHTYSQGIQKLKKMIIGGWINCVNVRSNKNEIEIWGIKLMRFALFVGVFSFLKSKSTTVSSLLSQSSFFCLLFRSMWVSISLSSE